MQNAGDLVVYTQQHSVCRPSQSRADLKSEGQPYPTSQNL